MSVLLRQPGSLKGFVGGEIASALDDLPAAHLVDDPAGLVNCNARCRGHVR
jgi:hypothetical protein